MLLVYLMWAHDWPILCLKRLELHATKARWAYRICVSNLKIYCFLFFSRKTKTKQVKIILKIQLAIFLVGEQVMDYTHNAWV